MHSKITRLSEENNGIDSSSERDIRSRVLLGHQSARLYKSSQHTTDLT